MPSTARAVRLAELVAALSLGVDLGFGQPMEHVLRQCLIALRLAERVGLDEDDRAVVYYTALLVNVGCHTDAHEQAKWFGDDIALKSGKYEHEFGSVRGPRRRCDCWAAATRRFIGSASGWSSRCPAPGPRRHDRAARRARATLAEQLGLPEAVLDGPRCGLRAVGRQGMAGGAPGRRRSRSAARLAQMAEFVEVAHRIGGVGRHSPGRARAGKQFDPRLARLLVRRAEGDPRRPRHGATWDAVIGAEPALRSRSPGSEFDEALVAVANFVDLKSPVHSGPRPRRSPSWRGGGARARSPDRSAAPAPRRARARPRTPRASRTRSGTSADRSAPGEWERVRHPSLPHRADARASPRRWRRLGQSPCSTVSGSMDPATHGGYRARRSRGRRGSSAPPTPISRSRTAPPSAARSRPTRPPRELRARGHGRRARRRRRRGRAGRRRSPRTASARGARRADPARGRSAAAAGAGPVEQGDRRAARDLAEDGRATTSSTSTRRSAPPTAPARACSQSSMASCPRRRSPPEDGENAPCPSSLRA